MRVAAAVMARWRMDVREISTVSDERAPGEEQGGACASVVSRGADPKWSNRRTRMARARLLPMSFGLWLAHQGSCNRDLP
jgi:hypothetical protein